MCIRDRIEAHIQDIYGIPASDSTVSRITDKSLSPKSDSRGRWRPSLRWYFWTPPITMSAARGRS